MYPHKEKKNCCYRICVWPPGKLVGKSDGLTELLHIPNSAKVVNIKDPQPGMWSIQVNTSVFTWECVQNYLSRQIPVAELSFEKTNNKQLTRVTLKWGHGRQPLRFTPEEGP